MPRTRQERHARPAVPRRESDWRLFDQLPILSQPGGVGAEISAAGGLRADPSGDPEPPGGSPSPAEGPRQPSRAAPTNDERPPPIAYAFFARFLRRDLEVSAPRAAEFAPLVGLGLGSVYGDGPERQAYLYDSEDVGRRGVIEKLRVGRIAGCGLPDLPRYEGGAALVGDSRADRYVVDAQLHLAFLLAHNKLVDRARAAGVEDARRAAATTLRRLYHHVAWHDFARRWLDREVFARALHRERTMERRCCWRHGLEDVVAPPLLGLPLELVCVLRVIESTADAALASRRHGGLDTVHDPALNAPFRELAAADGTREHGRGPGPLRPRDVVQWDWFLELSSSGGRYPLRAQPLGVPNELDGEVADPQTGEAERLSLRLPAADAMVRWLGLESCFGSGASPVPLSRYLALESEAGSRLGKLGSVILGATLAAALLGDPTSWFRCDPGWSPESDPLLRPGEDDVDSAPEWTLASIVRLAGLAGDAESLRRRAALA
ncbi:MAG: hypothetical protein DWQ36_02995 [Acidobacteria bacterium]|nr:MAG: hypothetical protein DWQ30_02410 [Acidobacteriota bacterium]REK11091.1 MAG: hypothetical protein DWQ36_02995 [Acidobacteriota bacterium]